MNCSNEVVMKKPIRVLCIYSSETLYPVKVVEGRSELVHLLLADALGVAGQDLGLDLIDGTGDGGEKQLPTHTDVLLTVVEKVLK